jgi:hypothetical protein
MQNILKYKIARNFSTRNGSLVYPDRFVNYFLKPDYYAYQDNSLIIEKIFNNNFTECILAPQNYGKTFSLETMKYFLSSNNLVEEKVDKSSRYNFFKNLKIQNWNDFNAHFANYPVVSFDFSTLDCSSHTDNLEKFRYMVALQYEQVLQYLHKEEYSKKITSVDVKLIEEFFEGFKTSNETYLINSCKNIGKILLKLTNQNPFYLIDDYDYPLLNSYNLGFYEETLNFLQAFVNIVFKNNNFINKTIITGANLMENQILFSPLNRVNYNFYDDKNPYSSFYHDRGGKHNDSGLKILYKNFNKDMVNTKTICELLNKCENFTSDKKTQQGTQSNLLNRESIDLSQNLHKKFTSQNIFNFLNYNGYLNSKGNITGQVQAQNLKETFEIPLPADLMHSFHEKLNYAYYYYFENQKIDQFFDYLKKLFEFVNKNVKSNTVPNLLPESPLSFRNEKEFETYLIDVMTIDMANNAQKNKILSIDDDENTKVSENLKQFSLITNEHKNFAIFLKANKLKSERGKGIGKTNIENQGEEIKEDIQGPEELMNNPNLKGKQSSNKKKIPNFQPTSAPSLQEKLNKLNEEALASVDKQEAIDFLMKISSEYEKAYFISVSNFQRKIEYGIEIVKLEKE